jgi:hypothetical protein
MLKPINPVLSLRPGPGAPAACFALRAPGPTSPGDAGDVADRMGAVAAGVRRGGCAWGAAPDGPCLSLDTTGFVDFGGASSAAAAFTGDFTISFRAVVASLATYWMPVCRGLYRVDGYYVLFDPDGSIQLLTEAPGTEHGIATGPGATQAGTWHHYALVRSGATGAIYVDGTPMAVTGSLISPAANPARHLYLNRYDDGSYPAAAQVSGLTLYARALSPGEVAREAADPGWWAGDGDGWSDWAAPMAAPPSGTTGGALAAAAGPATIAATLAAGDAASLAAQAGAASIAMAGSCVPRAVGTLAAASGPAAVAMTASAGGMPAAIPWSPAASSPLAQSYCTDEDVAVRACGDFAVLCPAWQVLACGPDGAFAPGDPWTLRCARLHVPTIGLQRGHVVHLSGPHPAFKGDGELLAVEGASEAGVLLRRIGLPTGVGAAPAPAAGLAGVSFRVLTLAPQIESASYDANHLFGIDPLLPVRAPARLYDPRELRQWTVLTVLQRQLAAEVRGDSGDFAAKLKRVEADLRDLQARLTLRWGTLGDSEQPRSAFTARTFR